MTIQIQIQGWVRVKHSNTSSRTKHLVWTVIAPSSQLSHIVHETHTVPHTSHIAISHCNLTHSASDSYLLFCEVGSLVLMSPCSEQYRIKCSTSV